jgi:DNA-binding MarR family transcriptional regulator
VPDSAAEPLPLDQYLTWRLHRINKLSDKGSADAYAAQLDLPVGEARCLAAIGSFAPLSIVDLAARANLDKGQASRAAQALVDRGLVRKQASDTDGRGVVLTPTASGQRLWKKVMALIAQRNQDIFGCLSVSQRKQLAAILDRLIEQAQAMPAR